MKIRMATESDLPALLAIYERARAFMCETGNPTQWAGGYPSEKTVRDDLETQHLYAIEGDGGLCGVFAFFPEGDPAYDAMDADWLNPLPYGAIHRVASAGTERGVLGACVDYCLSVSQNLKIDTHKDNVPMQKALLKSGFIHCGTILLANGDPRLAFQRTDA